MIDMLHNKFIFSNEKKYRISRHLLFLDCLVALVFRPAAIESIVLPEEWQLSKYYQNSVRNPHLRDLATYPGLPGALLYPAALCVYRQIH